MSSRFSASFKRFSGRSSLLANVGVLVVDEHKTLAGLIALALQAHRGRVALVDSIEGALKLSPLDASGIGLVLLGSFSRTKANLDLITQLTATAGMQCPVLIYGVVPDHWPPILVRAVGLAGVIPRTVGHKQLVEIVAATVNGEVPFSGGGDQSIWSHPGITSFLDKKQILIVRYICGGLSNKAIAARLGKPESTIKMLVRNIYQKMGARNRASLVAIVAELAGASGSGLSFNQ